MLHGASVVVLAEYARKGRCWVTSAGLMATLLPIALAGSGAAAQKPALEAQRHSGFWEERRGLVERNDLVLQRPNTKAAEALPLGNGRLGAAVWAEDGLTMQLNRADTLPARLSPGQIKIPGLKRLTEAGDYSGRLNLYDGEFTERGGGMRASVAVDASLDAMVIDVAGADPHTVQTATLQLWQPRKAQSLARGAVGTLSETWMDDQEAGASHERFGSLAAITADALQVQATVEDPLTVKLTFHPHADGSFRILVASPSWRGGDAAATASTLLAAAKGMGATEHQQWWHRFWEHAALLKLASGDHAAEYFENLRALYLFATAAESRDRFPGSQAGIGDLFSSVRDVHRWGPSDYWHWNLRMEVSANLGAGLDAYNAPFFRLYRENLPNLLAWTHQHMPGREGICQPETMRFNGQGYENESWLPNAPINCGEDSPPYYNARTISTGAEVALWMLDQYDYTGDAGILRANFPYMQEAARFLLAYGTVDGKGVLHTDPANAHEDQWDVRDPVTDIAAMRTFFPRFANAATVLHADPELAGRVALQGGRLPALPLVTVEKPKMLLADGASQDTAILASSYSPQAAVHNSENLGLEPVWPYGLIEDEGPLHEIAVRTFRNRPNKNENDWSYDPVQAARLGLAEEFRSSLRAITERYQVYPSGFAAFADGPEFYIEQIAIVADSLQKALADDYNGLIRIAPAWPSDWDADGTVYLRHRHRVNVRIRSHRIVRLEFAAGSSGLVRLRNPWPGEALRVVAVSHPRQALTVTSDRVASFNVQAGVRYQILQDNGGAEDGGFEPASGLPASAPKTLGTRSLGLAR